MSFRPMVKVDGEFAGNGLRFGTYEEAKRSASDLMNKWMAVVDYRVDESTDPVNYEIVDNAVRAVIA